ncbi:hypothetical protein [Mycoplasmopsis canis]|uniref:hypothetical protein n=1 Tax=Mycoplasmopsis canis TaxID=29555 RepID=UPI00030F26DA|nr:hypothetical protein [Mycoplasmopsis canis]
MRNEENLVRISIKREYSNQYNTAKERDILDNSETADDSASYRWDNWETKQDQKITILLLLLTKIKSDMTDSI